MDAIKVKYCALGLTIMSVRQVALPGSVERVLRRKLLNAILTILTISSFKLVPVVKKKFQRLSSKVCVAVRQFQAVLINESTQQY